MEPHPYQKEAATYFVVLEDHGRYFYARTKARRPNRPHNIEWRHKPDDASQFTVVGAQETARRFANVRAAAVPANDVLRVVRLQELAAQEREMLDAAE